VNWNLSCPRLLEFDELEPLLLNEVGYSTVLSHVGFQLLVDFNIKEA
jgi:hypothetical protein